MKTNIEIKINTIVWFSLMLIVSNILWGQFGGGSGTPDDPYLVQTPQHLDNVRNFRSACFLQTADIDLGIRPYNQGLGWTYLGSVLDPFTGTYDGGCHNISNQYQNNRALGIFGYTQNARILHVRLQNCKLNDAYTNNYGGSLMYQANNTFISDCQASVNITGGNRLGGLVGFLDQQSIMEFCSVSGKIISYRNPASNTYTGGLVGLARSSTINNCKANVFIDLTGPDNTMGCENMTGGLVGKAYSTSINSCQSSGSIRAYESIGGLVGSIYSSIINNSSSSADVYGNSSCGGLVGLLDGTLNYCFSTGFVQRSFLNGGLVGNLGYLVLSSVNCSYWDIQTSTYNVSAGGFGRTTDQMTYPFDADTFIGWDFDNIWAADSTYANNEGYPHICANELFGAVSAVVLSDNGGVFMDIVQLTMQSTTPFSTIRYTLDGSIPDSNSSIYSTPILISSTVIVRAVAFRNNWVSSLITTALFSIGAFAGGSGTASNPYLVDNAYQLNDVRYFPNAWFKQTSDIDLNVLQFNCEDGWNPIGGWSTPFSGHFDGDGWKISNIYINSILNNIGLFGYVYNAELKNIVLTDAEIYYFAEYGNSGILVGASYSSVINNCMTGGVIDGWYRVGGLIGEISASTISNCFSTASVTGYSYVGGLIGELEYSSVTNTVSNCYSLGAVMGYTPFGGLIGYNMINESIISASYWNTETSGMNVSHGGIGRNTEEMIYPYSDNTYEGWDFTNVWQADTSGLNNGYPYLRYLRQVNRPVITYTPVEGGEPVMVTILCETPHSTIFYTIDGSIPNETSTVYHEPFWVEPDADSTIIIKAIAYRDNMNPGQIAIATIYFGIIPTTTQDYVTPINTHCYCYPNPFSSNTTFIYYQLQKGQTQISVYNAKGQRLRSWQINGKVGVNSMVWDGTSETGKHLPDGIYFVKFQSDSATVTRKLLLLR